MPVHALLDTLLATLRQRRFVCNPWRRDGDGQRGPLTRVYFTTGDQTERVFLDFYDPRTLMGPFLRVERKPLRRSEAWAVDSPALLPNDMNRNYREAERIAKALCPRVPPLKLKANDRRKPFAEQVADEASRARRQALYRRAEAEERRRRLYGGAR